MRFRGDLTVHDQSWTAHNSNTDVANKTPTRAGKGKLEQEWRACGNCIDRDDESEEDDDDDDDDIMYYTRN